MITYTQCRSEQVKVSSKRPKARREIGIFWIFNSAPKIHYGKKKKTFMQVKASKFTNYFHKPFSWCCVDSAQVVFRDFFFSFYLSCNIIISFNFFHWQNTFPIRSVTINQSFLNDIHRKTLQQTTNRAKIEPCKNREPWLLLIIIYKIN